MPLEEYQRKRRFGETPEPSGREAPPAKGNSFVVQKHDATRLHYDLRLEHNGVLLSWAVPKGPSLNPKDKRLAVRTEDHPLDYANFEGIIPEGNYGAGTVMVWDKGTWELEGKGTVEEQLARGDLKSRLNGQKLRGSFALVHTGKRSSDPKAQNNWLLIKHRDEAADENWDIDKLDWSVLTGRSLKEIEEGKPARASNPGELPGARKAAMPSSIEPNLATLIDKPFSDPGWIFELKWDGMRLLAWIRNGRCELRSRNARVVTSQFPELAVLPERLVAKQAIVDGEAVVLDASGRPDFGLMQQRMNVAHPSPALLEGAPVTLCLFDIIYCDGYDLRKVPLIERKRFLRRILVLEPPVRVSEHVAGEGEELFRLASEQGLEGIIAKQANSPYCEGRCKNWLKVKATREVDAVIGGFTAPRGSRHLFGALLLGLYDDSKLRYIGSVGTGFNERNLPQVWERLQKLVTDKMPFAERPQTREKQTYVKPELVARVKFIEWTRDKHLRAPVFLGVRPDLDPKECRFDTQTAPAAAPPDPRDIICSSKEPELELDVEGKHLRFRNLDKVYFPEVGLTKRDLLCYYARVAPYILPFLRNRPLTLRRRPDGMAGEEFYQKEAEHAPEWARTVVIESEGKPVRHYVCDDLATLLYLTNLGCIDHNPWPSTVDHLDSPDYLFIDLDPTEGAPFTTVIEVARAANAVLTEIGMKTFMKTSGATGIHIFVPLECCYDFKQAGLFTQLVARAAGARVPDLVTWERTVAKRPAGKVLIDYSQLSYGRTLACVYSVRPQPLAIVSAPITAKELRKTLKPERFTIPTMPERIDKVGDLWADFWQSRHRIEPALEKLNALLAAERRA